MSEDDNPIERLKAHLEKHKHREQVFVSTAGLRMLLTRVEATEKALAELKATLVQEDIEEIQYLKARIEDTRKDRADAWNQRNAIYAELTKAQARADAAEARAEDFKQRLGSEMSARSQAQVERYTLAQQVKELTAALERRGEIVFGREGD